MVGLMARWIQKQSAFCYPPTRLSAAPAKWALLATSVAVLGTTYAQPPASVQLKQPGQTANLPIEDADTRVPDRARVFRPLSSEAMFLENLQDEHVARATTRLLAEFPMPTDYDLFDRLDRNSLGPLWKQNLELPGLPRDFDFDVTKTPTRFAIRNNRAVFPGDAIERRAALARANEQANVDGRFLYGEAAMFTGSYNDNNHRVAVDIELNDPEATAGVIFRAADSARQTGDIISTTPFYFAVIGGPDVVLGKIKNRQVTELARAPASREMSGRLEATVYTPIPADRTTAGPLESEITVSWNGQTVLRYIDNDQDLLYNTNTGIVVFSTNGKDIYFDNFVSERYGGPFEVRMFACSTVFYEGANVFHWPILLEQPALERYGHNLGNPIQAPIAHAVFFFDVIGLPYSIARGHICQLVDDREFHRPGDVVLPFQLVVPEYSHKGMAAEVAVLALGFAVLP